MGCCCPKKKRPSVQEHVAEDQIQENQSQPLIEQKSAEPGSPNTQRKKKQKNGRQQAEINPFNKPSK